jgi:hypothetical protein
MRLGECPLVILFVVKSAVRGNCGQMPGNPRAIRIDRVLKPD